MLFNVINLSSEAFSSSYIYLSIPGTEIINLKERFASVDRQDAVTFKLTSQHLSIGRMPQNREVNWVTLDPETGIVTVNTPVDREKDCGDDDSIKCIVKVTVRLCHLKL